MGIGDADAVALAGFLPTSCPTWKDNGRDVTFYPFMIVVERSNNERAFWLPYFHVIRDPAKSKPICKYGQWAPFMRVDLFEDVLRQARSAGYLAGEKID